VYVRVAREFAMSRLKLMSFAIAAATSMAAIAAFGAATQAVPMRPASSQRVIQNLRRAQPGVQAQLQSSTAPQHATPFQARTDPDADSGLHTTPEVSWARPDFIDRVYFAHAADSTRALATPPPDRPDAWASEVWEKGRLWLIVEVSRAPEEQRLCVRWLDGRENVARSECKPLGPGSMHLAFSSVDSLAWPPGT
jgi:hypothetical protein